MQKFMGWLRAAWITLLVAGVIIILDQWTKGLVRENIEKFTSMIPIEAFGEYFQFEHVDNYGAAFGILQNQDTLFLVIAAVVVVAILVYVRYLPMDQWIVRVLLGLQLGGAIGNVIDRINQGFVTDFIKMGIPGVYFWPNYNIADSAIVIGVIGLGIYIVWEDLIRNRGAEETESAEKVVSASASSSAEK